MRFENKEPVFKLKNNRKFIDIIINQETQIHIETIQIKYTKDLGLKISLP